MTVIEKLKDLDESMNESFKHIDALLTQQKELASIITKSKTKIDFKEFIDGLNESNENYDNQFKTLEKRHSKLKELINLLENGSDADKHLVELLLQVFGTIDTEEEKKEEA